jgi:hypothetical protein
VKEFSVDVDKLNKHNLNFIEKQGFVHPSDEIITGTPEWAKSFEFIISEMTQDELLNRMAVFTALYASVSVNEALAMTQVAGYEHELEIKKGQVMQLSSLSKVTDKRQEALINDDVISLQEKLTVAESRLKLLSALRISYDKYAALFSRGLTVRMEEQKLT